jgi:hypothetical protein
MSCCEGAIGRTLNRGPDEEEFWTVPAGPSRCPRLFRRLLQQSITIRSLRFVERDLVGSQNRGPVATQIANCAMCGRIRCVVLVPEEGVEPSRPEGHGILSPARLPVSPLRPGGSVAILRDFQVPPDSRRVSRTFLAAHHNALLDQTPGGA